MNKYVHIDFKKACEGMCYCRITEFRSNKKVLRKKSGVYILLKSTTPVYFGKSKISMRVRVLYHKLKGKKFNGISWVCTYPNEAESVETAIMSKCKHSLYNKVRPDVEEEDFELPIQVLREIARCERNEVDYWFT